MLPSRAPEEPTQNGTRIPFNRPSFVGSELQYIAEAIERGHISGDGEFTARCQSFLETQIGVKKAFLTTSCTHALEMAALLLRCGPGDEVILPSFTFVSTANAFVLRGARPVFVDVRRDTLNIDESRIAKYITKRTKAIVPVHYAGVGCDMDEIVSHANASGVAIIEDNAHGIFGRYRNRPLGTFGPLSTLSFHETKNFTCGEGGALLINDERMIERAEIIREKGTNRNRFFRGQVDKYTWVDVGSSYLPSDVLAAFLLAQLEAKERIEETRRRIWGTYNRELAAWAAEHGVTTPHVPAECQQTFHMYLPLHLSEMGRRFGGRIGDCPVAESVSDVLLRLPFYNDMGVEAQARVIEALLEFKDW